MRWDDNDISRQLAAHMSEITWRCRNACLVHCITRDATEETARVGMIVMVCSLVDQRYARASKP
jgi:hypothetical protein